MNMNSAEFKAFHLHSDSTLKRMTKDELIDYIHVLHHNWKVTDEWLERLNENLEEIKNIAIGDENEKY